MATMSRGNAQRFRIPLERFTQFQDALHTQTPIIFEHFLWHVLALTADNECDVFATLTACTPIESSEPMVKPIDRLFTYEVINVAGWLAWVRANGVTITEAGDLVFTDTDTNNLPVYMVASGQWSRAYLVDPEQECRATHVKHPTYIGHATQE